MATQSKRKQAATPEGQSTSAGYRRASLSDMSKLEAATMIIEMVRLYLEAGHEAQVGSDAHNVAILLPGFTLDDGGKLVVVNGGK